VADNLYTLLREGFPADGARPVLETPAGRRYSYAELEAATAQVANTLVAMGVKPGDRVAAQVEKSPENVFLCLGCARAGAVYLPLNTAYTPQEIDYFVGDAAPALLVCRPGQEAALQPIAARAGARLATLGEAADGSFWTAAAGASTAFADIARGADELCAILYTSGTTGRSKGAMLSRDNLLSNARTLRDYWRFTSADVLLHALPIYHTHGLFVAINVMLSAGGTMLFLPRFDLDTVFRLLPRATAMMGVPTFYTRLLGDPRLSRAATAHVRLFVSGSAPLLAETHRAFEARTGHRILERYGMTETNMNTSNPYDGERRAGTVGFPLPGVELRIADPDSGRPVPQGEIGVIEVKGPNVFKGYWRMPEKTAAEFRADGFFITGDLGRIDERGYVHIVGRGKDLVITGGFNVYPKEIEDELDALPGVEESAVIGLPHPDFGEAVTAVIVRRPGAALDEAAVQAALAGRLAKFKQPKRVLFVDALPRNSMGKVQKAELRRLHAGLYGG
jgi:malonyl-CoA/methylmalonyl-CoA synthetase